MAMAPRISLDRDEVAAFCRRWGIAEMSFFGSVLRNDFREDSDVDVLVSFRPGAEWSLLDHVRMEEELGRVLGRKADIVTRPAVERSGNWIRREQILSTAEPVYAEG